MLKEELKLAGALLALFLSSLSDSLVKTDSNSDRPVDDVSDANKVVFSETTSGHGRSAHAKATRDKSGAVARDSVLVGRDTNKLEDTLNATAVNAMRLEVGKDKVVIGAAADKAVAETTLALLIAEALGECLRVGENLSLVSMEVRRLGLLQSNCQGGDGVVVRAALVTRENGVVDRLLQVVQFILFSFWVLSANASAEENKSTARTTQTLVTSRGDNVGILEGSRENLGSNKSRNMGHIGEHVRVDLVTDLADALVVDEATIGASTCHNDLGSVKSRKLLHLVVVNLTSRLVKAVGNGLKVLRHGRDLLCGGLVAVGKMTTVRQIKAHETVMGIHERRVDVEIGGSTRKGYAALECVTRGCILKVWPYVGRSRPSSWRRGQKPQARGPGRVSPLGR